MNTIQKLWFPDTLTDFTKSYLHGNWWETYNHSLDTDKKPNINDNKYDEDVENCENSEAVENGETSYNVEDNINNGVKIDEQLPLCSKEGCYNEVVNFNDRYCQECWTKSSSNSITLNSSQLQNAKI